MDPAYLLLQIFSGLVTGSFYALLSLGLAIIFGMLRVVNFAHGSLYMLGAFAAYIMLQQFAINFWLALVLAPLAIAVLGMFLERMFIRRLYALDPLYNFLLTFGIAIILQDAMRLRFGIQGQPYLPPAELTGVVNFGLIVFPTYRVFVIGFSLVVCLAVWFAIERTRVGVVVRAATEKSELTRALGIDVDRWITPVFGFGVALAALGGVLAAPMYNVAPLMGADLIIVIFAVVVIGGLGSIAGSIITGLFIGVVAALTAVFLPQLKDILVFVLMAVVLLVRPAGLLGSEEGQ